MELDHLSHSTFSTLSMCSEKFRLTKQVGLKEAPSWASVGGSAVHTTTENRDLLHHFGIVDSDTPLDFQDVLDKEVALQEQRTGVPKSEWKMSGRAPNKQGESWWRMEGPPMVQRWTDWLDNTGYSIWLTPDGEPGIEIELQGDLGGGPVTAFVDRVLVSDYGLGVVDLKSGTHTPDTALQLGTYAKLLSDRWPEEDFRWGAFFMNREGKCTPPEMLAQWRDRLELDYSIAWQQIHAELFLPSPGRHCDYMCGVKEYCRLMGNEKRLQYLPTRKAEALV